ncbi:MAG: NusG domain II-containing protein [Clostridiales Family XIII bacterium]|jgi:hypothetical protein|nr:NusG domain II-containing protein [Clostridiales Family XIII bacterium]
MEKKPTSKNIRRNDIILIVGVLLVGAVLFIVIASAKTDGARVDVLVNGDVAESYPLREDRTVELAYNGHNLLRIEDGTATVTAADCPDKLCVKQRTISKEGETIVCLPHRVVIRISGGEASGMDGVVR